MVRAGALGTCACLVLVLLFIGANTNAQTIDNNEYWIDAYARHGDSADGSLLKPFSTLEEGFAQVSPSRDNNALYTFNLSPGAKYAWGESTLSVNFIIRRCITCPERNESSAFQLSVPDGPIIGQIPELAPVYADENASDDYLAYLDEVQALEYRDAVIIEYCVGLTMVTSCPHLGSVYRFEHVAFHTVWCGTPHVPSSTQDPTEPADQIPSRYLSHRPFILSCPCTFTMQNVLFYDIAAYRSLIFSGINAQIVLQNFTIASSVLTRLPVVLSRESFLTLDTADYLSMTNTLFWNNTNQAPTESAVSPLIGGVIMVQGTLISTYTTFLNNSVIQHLQGCTIPMANASATYLNISYAAPPLPGYLAEVRGGAMGIFGSSTSLQYGWFINNQAIRCIDVLLEQQFITAFNLPSGGAIHVTDSSILDLMGVKFINNVAKVGGALSIGFGGNKAFGERPAGHLGDHLNIISCTFDSNTAEFSGADIYVNGQHIVAIMIQYSTFRDSRTSSNKRQLTITKRDDTEHLYSTESPSRQRSGATSRSQSSNADWVLHDSTNNPASIFNYHNDTHHARASASQWDTPPIGNRFFDIENEIPWGTSIAVKSQVRFSADAYLKISECNFDRYGLSPNNTVGGMIPIISPLINVQQFTTFGVYDSNISYVIALGVPLISASHVGATTLVGMHIFHVAPVSTFSSNSMFEVLYGGISENKGTPSSRTASTMSNSETDFNDASSSTSSPHFDYSRYRAQLKREKLDERLALLRSKGFFDLYPSTDPLGAGSTFDITYDADNIASYSNPRTQSPLEDERVPSWLNEKNDFSGAHQTEFSNNSSSAKRTAFDYPNPAGFCATTLSEPISAGTNDHTPELLIFGFYIYECSSANSVLTALSLKSVKIIEAHWDLVRDSAPSPPTRKPWDFALYLADIYGYALVERTSIANSILPVMIIRSNVVELGAFSLHHPINEVRGKFTKPALIVRDSASLYYHDAMLVGYKTTSRLSPVVIDQVRDSVYLRKVDFIGNEGAQNGGALTLSLISSGLFSMSSAVIDTCSFTHNVASSGGGIYSYGSLFIKNSNFVGNSANNGGGIFAASHTLCIYNTTFVDNFARNQGGAILSQALNTALFGSHFTRGLAHTAGGAIAASYGNLATVECTFKDCKALDGAAIATIEFDPTLATPPNTQFWASKRSAAHLKPASASIDSQVEEGGRDSSNSNASFSPQWKLAEFLLRIDHCIFSNNLAVAWSGLNEPLQPEFSPWPTAFSSPKNHRGGAIYTCQLTKVLISSCDFNGNMARTGGAIYSLGSPRDLFIVGCLFEKNAASYAGGALAIFSQALSATEIPDNPFYTPVPVHPEENKPLRIASSRFLTNTAVFGAGMWLTPDEGREVVLEDLHWEDNFAHWGAAVYFSGYESSVPVTIRSNITHNTALVVGASMFFNGPPATNNSRIKDFCSADNGCLESNGTSSSFWGSNMKERNATSATTGYALQFTLSHGEFGKNTSYTPVAFNFSAGAGSNPIDNPMDSSEGNCLLVDPDLPFTCSSDPSGSAPNCARPPELKTHAGNMTLSITLTDALGQVVDDLNSYITCFTVVENANSSVGVLWKPGTVSYLSDTVSFLLAVPSKGHVLDEASLYIPDSPRYESTAVLVVGVENASTGSSAVSAAEPNRFLSTPLTLVPVRLSGCMPGYGLQRYSADPVWAVCDVCPEGTYNFNGDGNCWLCADPSLPYSLVSCSYMNVRPMLGVFVAPGAENDFDIIICPYGFCSNCTAQAYTSYDHMASPLRGGRLINSAYWSRTEHSKKDHFLGFLDYLTGSEDTVNTYGSSHFRKNPSGNYDWIIDELENESVAIAHSSNASLHGRPTEEVSEADSTHEEFPTRKRPMNDPALAQCPNGDCVIGRDPASPICGRCAPGYYESLVFDVCSLKVCKTRQTGAIIGVALAFVGISLFLHVAFYRYPAKTSISLFFLQVLPLLRVDLFSLLLENDKLRNVFCLARVTTPLTRVLFFQLVPFYFAVSIITIFGFQRIFALTYGFFRRCIGAQSGSKKARKMGRLQQDYQASSINGPSVNTSITDELYHENGANSDTDDVGDENLQIGSMETSSQTTSATDDALLSMDLDDPSTGLLHKRPATLRHISDWDQREAEPFFASSRLCRTLIALASLTLIPGMRLFADLFHCVSVPGYKDTFWQPAPSITCQSLSLRIAKGISFPIMILIIGGLTALYGRTIAIYKKRIVDGILVPPGSYDAHWLRNMAYFYESFRATRYFWFLLHIAERIFLPLCISFSWSNPGALHFSASVSLLISSLFQAFTWSYLDPWDNMASTLSLALLTLISLLRDSTFQGNVIDYASPRATFLIFLAWLSINLAFVAIEVGRFTVRFIQRRRRQ